MEPDNRTGVDEMITVLGSTNVDQIGRVERLPKPGETVTGSDFSMSAGGKGANQALAARRAGSAVRHVSAVGSDAFVDIALGDLRAAAVDITAIETSERHTGIAMILVDAKGENVIAVLPGANSALDARHAAIAVDAMAPGDALLLQQEIPQEATAAALRLTRERGLLSILNTAPCISSTREVAPLATVVIANEGEFCALAGCTMEEFEPAMLAWASRHGQTVIVTIGAQGALGTRGKRIIRAPALPITPLDTVGAGDAFCGYMADSLARGQSLEDAMHRATTAASLACLRSGAQPAIPSADAVEAQLATMGRSPTDEISRAV
jgi:ribokinase